MYVGVIYTKIICHIKNGEVVANGPIKLQGFYILGEAQVACQHLAVRAKDD